MQILRGSFPFAFFAFGDDDDAVDQLEMLLGMGGMGSSRGSSSRGVYRGSSLTYAQKKWMRMRMRDRKQEFEHAQAELEMLTEMLSGEHLKSFMLHS